MASGKKGRGLILAAVLSTSVAYAETLPVTIVTSIEISGKSTGAFLIVSDEEKIVFSAPAEVVEGGQVGSVGVVGRAMLPLDGGPYTALFMAFGDQGEVVSSTRVISDVRTEQAVLLDSSELQRRLGEQRSELKKLYLQIKQQRGLLNQAREEGESLKKVGQMIAGGDELVLARDEVRGVEASLEAARLRQEALKGREVPLNFKKREAELAAQLNTLSTEVKELELNPSFAGASKEYQEKRDLIEATKYEHIDLLKDELAQLRRKREELEQIRARK